MINTNFPVPLDEIMSAIVGGKRHLLLYGSGGGGKTINALAFGMGVLEYARQIDEDYRILVLTTDKYKAKERILTPLRKFDIGDVRERRKKWLSCELDSRREFVVGSLAEMHGLRGTEWQGCIIDELALIEQEKYNELDWRVRGKGYIPNWILSTTNTYGPYASWIYERFILKNHDDHKAWKIHITQNPDKEFVDNYLPILENNPNKRWILDAEWGPGEGARFPWALERGEVKYKDIYNLYIGFDWGISEPSAAVWVLESSYGLWVVHEKVWEGSWESRTIDKVINDIIWDTTNLIEQKYGGWFRPDLGGPKFAKNRPVITVSMDPACKQRDAHGSSVYDEFVKAFQKWWYPSNYITTSTNDHQVTNMLIEKGIRTGMLKIAYEGGRLVDDLFQARMGPPGKEDNLEPHEVTHTIYALGYALHKVVSLAV